MSRATDIEAFVHRCFDMYGLDYTNFFSEYADEEEDEEGLAYGGTLEALPIALGDEVDENLLVRIATTLGLSKDTLENMDGPAAGDWYRKYPYFEYRRKFNQARTHSLHFSGSSEKMLLSAIFDEDDKIKNFKRYDMQDVKKRLQTLLAEYDTAMPGCVHKDAVIQKLQIDTDNFTNFPQVKEMAEAYFAMVDRARELFYKLWEVDLSEDEVREYNFLVSVLGMRDSGYSLDKPIYYEFARAFVPIYKEEGYKNYSSYIIYRGADFPQFWKCKDFYDYPKLINKMVQEFPNTKSEMAQIAMQASNFLCSFVWSDEPVPTVSANDDKFYRGFLHSAGEDYPSQYHWVFVPKSKDELCGDEDYVERCHRLSSPVSKGGLKLPDTEIARSNELFVKRCTQRLAKKPIGGHYDGRC